MPPSVLVVGASGYIGFGIAHAYRRAGYKVYGVVRSEGSARVLVQNEIVPVIGDIDKPSAYADIIKECGVVVDGAGVKDVSRRFFEYVCSVQKSTLQNYKTLYIFTSGIMTYYEGHFNESLAPLDETHEPSPKDPHEMVPRKQFEDDVLREERVRAVVVRPGFVYGSHGGAIAPMFFKIDLNEKSLVLKGRPDKRWSWVHIDDLGEAYVLIAKAGSVVDNQLFNISAQDNPTYEELKVACAKAAGWKGTKEDVKYVALKEDEHRLHNWETNVIINPQKACDLLGWKPKHVGILNEIDVYYASWKAAQV